MKQTAVSDSLLVLFIIILGLAAVGSLVLLHKSKRHLYILRAGHQPIQE